MFRLVLLFITLLAVVRAGELSYSGDTSDLDTRTGELTLRGHARFTDGEFLLTADEVRYDQKNEIATAVGHVAFTRGTGRLLAEKLTLHRREQTFTAESVRFGTFPYFAEAATASGTRGEVTLRSATVSYHEPGPWRLSVAADTLTYAPGQRVRMENSRAGLGVARPLPLPHFHQELDRPLVSYLSATGGYRSSLGAFVEAGVHVPVAEGLRLGGDVGLYTARGLMAGPSGSYVSADGGAAWHGFFNTGFIRDHGEQERPARPHYPDQPRLRRVAARTAARGKPHPQRPGQLVARL